MLLDTDEGERLPMEKPNFGDVELLRALQFEISNNLEFARKLELMCAEAQGKGWGTATIQHEINCVAHLARSPIDLFVDVGANIGLYTDELRRKFPKSRAYLLEPALKNFALLTQKYTEEEDIYLFNDAISNEKSLGTLYSNEPGSGLASLKKRRLDHFGLTFSLEEVVKIRTLEDFWIDVLDRGKIDLVKFDIEGVELDALEGMGDAVIHTKLIQFEFGGANIDSRTFFQDFWYFFKEVGFYLWRITPRGPCRVVSYSEIDEFFSTTNYIAQNRS